MTQPNAVARSYAKAAFEVAQEHHEVAGWSADLANLADIFVDAEVKQVFANPRLDDRKRIGIAIAMLPEGLDRSRVNFVQLLVLARRTAIIPSVREVFEQMVAEAEGRTELEVVMAQEVPSDARERLGRLLGEKLGRQVELVVKVDPSILGGVIVRQGDHVTDGSVSRRLSEMREELLAS